MTFKKVIQTLTTLSTAFVVTSLSSCSKPFGDPDQFVKVDGKTYTLGELKSFSSMQYQHPDLGKEGFFPGKRFSPALFVETALLYDEAKEYESQVVGNKEWEWKQTFILAQDYQRSIVQNNMGATADELVEYFKKNKGLFLFEGKSDADTSFSAHYKNVIARRFIEYFPPSDIFKQKMVGMTTANIEQKWLEEQKKRPVDFFRDFYYEDTYGTPFPTDVNDFFGPGKVITQEDLDIIISWLPKMNQKSIEDPAKLYDIVGYMVTWKLFAEEANKRNIHKEAGFKQYAKYFERYEVVRHYLNTVLPERIGADRSSVNEEILQFAYWDTKGLIKDEIDSVMYNKMIDDVVRKRTDALLFEYIAKKRKEQGVTFLHADYKDDFAKTSDRLFFEADSLTNSGKRENAKAVYNRLINHYGYTPEGVEAHRALAMLYSDEGSYKNAITAYRDYLLLSEPSDDWCKVFFMIGYTYGEYLQKLDLAATNYRWVLKNRPDCGLIEDAEFMYLHLGEPMTDVEELQAENARQGRDILK